MKNKNQIMAEMAARIKTEFNSKWWVYTNEAAIKHMAGNEDLEDMKDFFSSKTKPFITDVVNQVLEDIISENTKLGSKT